MSRILQSNPVVAIITPAMADANNGNWRTASRWQQLLARHFRTIVQSSWPVDALPETGVVIALHARRSAHSIRRYRAQRPNGALIVVLTGTDLYADLAVSEEARTSLALADALIVLQEDAIQYVPHEYRKKTHVVYQSAKTLLPAKKLKDRLNCVVVGHLRAEKDPDAIFRLVESLPEDSPIHVVHIGAPLDEALAARAKALSSSSRHYHWAGALSHGLTRAAIKRSHLLIHPSVMEGGANVIVEAISSGTPVLASRMSGNLGMLGQGYAGYFAVGDVDGLRALLARCASDANFLLRLNTACAARAKLFSPEAERMALAKLIKSLVSR
ncbi:MAG: TIGR04348 family glycosyltransferase [Burkholderiales bacterium]|nr:TIGR04348 family glycosyltransferase [Burkholderiales bacterium]